MLYLMDLPRTLFNGTVLEFLVLLPDLVESEWLQSTSDILPLSDLEAFEEQDAHEQLFRYFPNSFHNTITAQAASYIHWNFSLMSERIRYGRIECEDPRDSPDLTHILIRFPKETVFVEHCGSEQDQLKVGVLTRE